MREAGAVLSGKRTEVGRAGAVKTEEGETAGGKGLFAQHGRNDGFQRDDESTASPSPGPYEPANELGAGPFDWLPEDRSTGSKRKAETSSTYETPHKAQKTGVYATPSTTLPSSKRKLPWLEQPATPKTTLAQIGEYFDTPSKAPPHNSQYSDVTAAPPEEDDFEPTTPYIAPPTNTNAAPSSPSPSMRHRDALHNPADSAAPLTSEVLQLLSTSDTKLPPDLHEKLRSVLSKHDLKTQGVKKGREIARLALKAKDAKIAELQARIASLEAEREMERAVHRMQSRKSGGDG